MSTYGVQTRFVDLLVRERGRVSKAAFSELVAYARDRGITSGEAKALLQPAAYLRTNRVLRSSGIGLDDVRLDQGAWSVAASLGQELGVSPLFPDLPHARPTSPGPGPGPGPTPTPAGGQSLGPASAWKIETSGAVITFEIKAGDRTYPAVVLANPTWKDPEPARDLVAEHKAELDQVDSLAKLAAFARGVASREKAYFEAGGAKPLLGQRRNQRRLVDQPAAGDVDEDATRA